ncbi:MAG: low molecular weight phosphotyrosine protein phosphatase [Chloroflexi bacterium]|nr:low molecular weight phosphotyrosine protein phosphatase [Chloroflexota bacterium]
MGKNKKVKVLFVCLGNICRSPMAEGVFRQLLAEHDLSHRVQVDSAGTAGYHAGERPDRRAQQATRRRGVDISRQRSRQVRRGDCAEYDYILAMDEWNLRDLQRFCPPEHRHKIRLFLDYAPHLGVSEVPDPYYGGDRGFEHVLDLIEEASQGLLQTIRRDLDVDGGY